MTDEMPINTQGLEKFSGIVEAVIYSNEENGYGVFTWTSGEYSGDKYVGYWKNGQMHGNGKYTY